MGGKLLLEPWKGEKHFLPLLGSSPRLSNKISDWPLVISPIAKNRLYSTFSVSAQKDPALSCHRESWSFFCTVILTKYSLVSSFQALLDPLTSADRSVFHYANCWLREKIEMMKIFSAICLSSENIHIRVWESLFQVFCVKEGIQIIKPRGKNNVEILGNPFTNI